MNASVGKIFNFFYRKSFTLWETFGFHITPNKWYMPIPDTRALRDESWSVKSDLIGINMNEKNQTDLLSLFMKRYKDEFDRFPLERTSVPYQYYVNNHGFESVDGELLYCFIRAFKPKKIIEIGSGNSTYLAAQSILANQNEFDSHKCELLSIEPYPNKILRSGFPGLGKLIISNVQDVPMSEFQTLEANDILFIDSSHVLKIGSDVQYEFLQILPRLNKGVIVHVHDIFLPSEYPKEGIMNEFRFPNEQYLLQAFLTFNDSFEVLLSSSYMHLTHPEMLEECFRSYNRKNRWPASFWMRRIK
ncbi:MAG: class I SAM-dependent methyltransferase [Nitrososphaerales archaeon]